MKITITGKQIEDHLAFRKLVNSANLEDIRFINKYGTLEDIPQESIEDFKFTGLNNFDFFATEYWKNTDEQANKT